MRKVPEINYLFGMLLFTFELLIVLLQMLHQGSAAEKHEGLMEEVHYSIWKHKTSIRENISFAFDATYQWP